MVDPRVRAELDALREEIAQLRAADDRHRELVESLNSIVLRWDPEGRVLHLNRYGLEFFGYELNEVVGRSVLDLIVPETESSGRDLFGMIADLLQHPERYVSNENENVRRDGERVWIMWRNQAVVDAEGRLREILSTGIDVTERRRAEEELRRLAERDDLTGLYNTRHLYRALEILIAASRERGERFSLVFMDLDRFKRVVDGHGHLAGSKAIQEVAATISGTLAPPAWAVAYAGDEFVIVLPGCDSTAAVATVEDIRGRMARTRYLAETGRPVALRASFGVATFPDDAADLVGLLALADRALFDVKRGGRDGVGSALRRAR